MITDQSHIDYFKKIAKLQFVVGLLNDYGNDKTDSLILLADSITNIYRYLNHTSFNSVTIYLALEESSFLSILHSDSYITLQSYENITPREGDEILIEIKENGEIHFVLNSPPDLATLRQNSFIYRYERINEIEKFIGKTTETKLIPIPGASSYFAIQTFKELEHALENYAVKVALHSECPDLQNSWYDANRIFFKKAPEHLLRDSLTRFLKYFLRNTEARPEQIMDKSHPVDIKVTWTLANRIALIEIKWLGKSLLHRKKQFNQQYFEGRGLEGASQLAFYLDENLKQAPTHFSKGYLVIYDARRFNTNTNTTTTSMHNGLFYSTKDIHFNPEFHNLRKDFHRPYRFFLRPSNMNP